MMSNLRLWKRSAQGPRSSLHGPFIEAARVPFVATTILALVGCIVGCGTEDDAETCAREPTLRLEHRRCGGLQFDIAAPEDCPTDGCGLIVDVHGWTMSGVIQEANTELRERGRRAGFYVVQPSAPSFAPISSWDPTKHDAPIRAFIDDAVANWNIDANRVHMTGFSQGGFMSWRFACEHADLIASIAPNAAGYGCPERAAGNSCLFGGDDPALPVDVLYLHGETDALVDYEACAIPQVESVVEHYGLELREEVVRDLYTEQFYGATDGPYLKFITHRMEAPSPILRGHCFPGSLDDDGSEPGALFAFGCTAQTELHWGAAVIDFFTAHPR